MVKVHKVGTPSSMASRKRPATGGFQKNERENAGGGEECVGEAETANEIMGERMCRQGEEEEAIQYTGTWRRGS